MKFSLEVIRQLFSSELSTIYQPSEIQTLFEIFCNVYLGYSPLQLRMEGSKEISQTQFHQFQNALSGLKTFKPYQQILGTANFYGKEFKVNEHTLIPRPETEELIELALNKMDKNAHLKILDIGTGSGCIGITLAMHLKNAEITAIDILFEALEVARENARTQHVSLNFIQADYLRIPLESTYDVIVSNPPYIARNEEVELSENVKNFEPKIALFAPTTDPLAFYKKIASDCERNLTSGGFLFLEINQKYGEETLNLFKNRLAEVFLLKDISGNNRFIWGRK